jgi:Lar family restriction alleviation protein
MKTRSRKNTWKNGRRKGMEEFKLCPFCGCHDRRVGIRKMGTKGYRVICSKCGSSGPYVKIADFASKMDAQGKAKETWNRRESDETD